MRIRAAIGIFSLLLVFGCINEELEPIDPTKAQLEISVKDILDNDPRADIKVTIHLNEADAESGDNPVLKARYTDGDGLVEFRNLEPGRTYWVRAKPIIGFSKEETEILVIGDNFHEIHIL